LAPTLIATDYTGLTDSESIVCGVQSHTGRARECPGCPRSSLLTHHNKRINVCPMAKPLLWRGSNEAAHCDVVRVHGHLHLHCIVRRRRLRRSLARWRWRWRDGAGRLVPRRDPLVRIVVVRLTCSRLVLQPARWQALIRLCDEERRLLRNGRTDRRLELRDRLRMTVWVARSARRFRIARAAGLGRGSAHLHTRELARDEGIVKRVEGLVHGLIAHAALHLRDQ